MDNGNNKDFRTRELERKKTIKVNENVDQNQGRTLGSLDSASSNIKESGKPDRIKDLIKKGKTSPTEKFLKTSPKALDKAPVINRGGGGGGGRIQSQQKFIKGGKVLPRLDFDILSEKDDRQTTDPSKLEVTEEGINSRSDSITQDDFANYLTERFSSSEQFEDSTLQRIDQTDNQINAFLDQNYELAYIDNNIEIDNDALEVIDDWTSQFGDGDIFASQQNSIGLESPEIGEDGHPDMGDGGGDGGGDD